MSSQNWSFTSGVLIGTVVCITLKWIHDKITKRPQIDDNKDDCFLFLPGPISYECVGKISNPCRHFSCSICNYSKFLALLNSAQTSLDICVYLITSEDITKAILSMFRKGVFVRIITDKQVTDEGHNSKIFVFLKEHIPLKVVDSDRIMHNKFVIIDKKKLLTGSFNWTKQGTSFNFENGVVIHNARIIKQFSEYFDCVWHSP